MSYGTDRLGVDAHTRTDGGTDSGNDNTRGPKLVSGKNNVQQKQCHQILKRPSGHNATWEILYVGHHKGPLECCIIQVLWLLWVICLSLWLCKETVEQSMGSSCKATWDAFSVSLHNPNDRHLSAVRAAQGDSGKGTVSGLWKTVKFSLITWSQKALQLRYPMCLDHPITKGRRRPCLITRGARCPGFRNHTLGYGDWESKQ